MNGNVQDLGIQEEVWNYLFYSIQYVNMDHSKQLNL